MRGTSTIKSSSVQMGCFFQRGEDIGCTLSDGSSAASIVKIRQFLLRYIT